MKTVWVLVGKEFLSDINENNLTLWIRIDQVDYAIILRRRKFLLWLPRCCFQAGRGRESKQTRSYLYYNVWNTLDITENRENIGSY